MQRSTFVGLVFAGRDEELHLIWIGGHFDIGQGLGPSGGTDQPQEGEHYCHYKILEETRAIMSMRIQRNKTIALL